MAGTLPPGPLEMLQVGAERVPLYVLPFDKDGALQAPLTSAHLTAAAADGVTDVFLLSHGWNTDWNDALDFYRRFLTSYSGQVDANGAPRAGGRSIAVGVSWPSVALPSSTAPAMAATPTVELDMHGIAALAEDIVAPADRPELYALLQQDTLDGAGARRLAELLAPLYARTDEDLPRPPAAQVDDILALWAALEIELAGTDEGLVVAGPTGAAEPDVELDAGPLAAGLLSFLDPRNIIRLATVLQMKDRAGVVGSRGVAAVLDGLLRAAPAARLHLIGHSYGCKVVLSAVCAHPLARTVRSMLLMQPALSYLALAEQLPDEGASGGYHAAKARCELPIVTTWTRDDFPLRTVFQLAVRRSSDLGEQDIGAAGRERPPSKFAAMGGWGPESGGEVRDELIRTPGQGRYDLAGTEVLALESNGVIKDHGNVVQDATAWVLYNLVAAG